MLFQNLGNCSNYYFRNKQAQHHTASIMLGKGGMQADPDLGKGQGFASCSFGGSSLRLSQSMACSFLRPTPMLFAVAAGEVVLIELLSERAEVLHPSGE